MIKNNCLICKIRVFLKLWMVEFSDINDITSAITFIILIYL